MPRYKPFQKNPITNEWRELDWVEADSQQAAMRQVAESPDTEYFVVPASSYHPAKLTRVESVRWEFTENGNASEIVEAKTESEPVEA